MNLLEQINHSPYFFYFLVVDDLLDIYLPELDNFISISAEKLNIKIGEKNSGRLLSHPETIKFITDHSGKHKKTPVIVPFKPSARIESVCSQHGWKLASNPSKLNRFLEDKIKFRQTFSSLPLIPSEIIQLNNKNYLRYQEKFGQKLVIQTHFGWAGNCSYISQQYSDIEKLIPENTTVKISPYLDGYSLINNCCIHNKRLIQSPPGLQYTGLSQLTDNPLATVGRQWPSLTSHRINSQVETITDSFSKLLSKYGYRGFFGLDFLVSNNKVYLVECNPRLTASFALYTSIEKKHQLTPLFLLHLAEFIDIHIDEETHFHHQLTGSEIINRQLHKKYSSLESFSSSAESINIPHEIIEHVL